MESSDITLLQEDLLNAGALSVKLIETHISWILLTGMYAYKIKKPVNFGFLDFSTLNKRRFYCEEEVRLNSRFSSGIYVGAVPVIKQGGRIILPEENEGGTEREVIDYAVKMRQFDRSLELDKVQENKGLDRNTCQALGKRLSKFHAAAEKASPSDAYGEPATIQAPILDNFQHLNQCLHDEHYQNKIERLRTWTDHEYPMLSPCFIERKRAGFVRECHGDLHLGNITLIDGQVTFFDCIEFNPDFRWIDTMCELAFLLMDLESRDGNRAAHWVLHYYLTESGDYTGLKILNYYKVYRALVRAKIAELTWFNTKQTPSKTTSDVKQQALLKDFGNYIDRAIRYIQTPKPVIILMHGISGTGKSTIASQLAERIYAVHIRSDIERKRLLGLKASEATEKTAGVAYSASTSDDVFNYLLSIAQTIVQSGSSVIVDATFILQRRRAPFLEWAKQQNIPSIIFICHVPIETREIWIQKRAQEGLDPSEATIQIAQKQQQELEPIGKTECNKLYSVDASIEHDVERVLALIEKNITSKAFAEKITETDPYHSGIL
jgi:aminoglycoside phosphotransferase family enzyme/cytidylate kinase